MKREHQFKQRLFWAYSLVIVILLLIIFAGIFFMVYRDKVEKEVGAQQEFVSKTQQQIDTSLQNMDRMISGLLYNKSFMRIMRDEDILASYIQHSNEILDTMVALDAPHFSSHRIIAFTPETYFTFTKTGEDQAHILKAIASYAYYDQVAKAEGERVVLPVHIDPFGIVDVPVYSVARVITDGINVYGIVEAQNNYEQLEVFCSIDSQFGSIALLSKEGDVVYPWKSTEKESFLQDLYGVISQKKEHTGTFTWESNQVSFSVSPYSQWITIMYCPLSNMMPDMNFVNVLLLGFAAVLLSMLGLIYILTKRLTAPLSEFDRLIQQVSFDNLSVPLPKSYGIAEIENISRSFQAMLNQLKVQIARNAQSKANEERANYIALQAQMNPHTIYNTIAMIESVCYVNGDLEAASLCIAFSQMLRYISDNQKKTYTVEDELQHLDRYATLMQKRYEGRLQIQVTAEPSLSTMTIPKFTLQPLVENAIKHGMNRNSRPFAVDVAIEKTPLGWHIRVSDNGTGFPEDKIQEIYDHFAYCDACLLDNKSDMIEMRLGNMALNNIYIRWRILSGSHFQMRIENRKPSGCLVELSVREE